MTLLYYDPIYLEHDTGGHPEKADRLRCIVKHLAGTGLDCAVRRLPPDRFRPSGSRGYMIRSTLRKSAISRRKTVGTWKLTRSSAADHTTRPCMAAGAVCDAVQRVVRGEERRRFAWYARRGIMPWRTARWASACSTTWRSPPAWPRRSSTWTGC